MSEKQGPTSPQDPFESWRAMRDATMKTWADTMVQTVNTEAYAQATGAMLESYLTASAPFRELIEKMMTQALQLSNMPVRTDIVALAERLTNLELRIDDMDSKLDTLIEQLRRGRAAQEGG
jgi:polyhydroxyalkanoate synthesis regulator phasin